MQPQGPQSPGGQGNPYDSGSPTSYTPPPPQPGSMPSVPQPGVDGNPYATAPNPYMAPAGTAGKPSDAVIPPPPPRPQSPYDFFMDPQKPKSEKKPFTLPGNKFVWIIGGGVALIGLITAVALSAPKEIPKLTLVAVAQAQTETSRLCSQGVQDAKLQPTKSFALNCHLTQLTQSRQLANQLKKSNVPIGDDILGGGRSSTSDSKLKSAKSSSNYDETFITVMEAQLQKQSSAIKKAAASAEANVTERQLLNTYVESTKLLTTQLKPVE